MPLLNSIKARRFHIGGLFCALWTLFSAVRNDTHIIDQIARIALCCHLGAAQYFLST